MPNGTPNPTTPMVRAESAGVVTAVHPASAAPATPMTAAIAAALVLDGVQRLGERLLLVLIIIQGLQDAVLHISFVESIWVLRANVAPRPASGEGDCLLVHASCLSLKVPGPFRRLRKTLASTLPLPPDLCQKCEEIFQWIEARKRNGLTGDGASD